MQPFADQALRWLSADVVWLGLLHSVWIGLAAAATVALALQMRQTLSHRFRHAILLASLLLVAFGSPSLAVVQHLAASRLSQGEPVCKATAIALPGPPGDPPRVVPDASATSPPEGNMAAARVFPAIAAALVRLAAVMRTARPLVLTVWSVVVLGLGTVLALAHVG